MVRAWLAGVIKGWVPREVRAKQQGRQEDRKMRIPGKGTEECRSKVVG